MVQHLYGTLMVPLNHYLRYGRLGGVQTALYVGVSGRGNIWNKMWNNAISHKSRLLMVGDRGQSMEQSIIGSAICSEVWRHNNREDM